MKYKVVIHDAEEGGYWAEVPELPGCVTEADTFEELQVNIREAIALWLDLPEGAQITKEDHFIEIAI
jgi:predicted RNase H-like HicB family nuclease